VVLVTADAGVSWVGFAEASGLGGVTGEFGCPDPTGLCLLNNGQPYLIDVLAPSPFRELPVGTQEVFRPQEAEILILRSFTDMTGVGRAGLAWTSERLCADDLRVEEALVDGIACSGEFHGSREQFTVDPMTGRLIEGWRFSL
jgi:hypothetical protein